MIRYNGQRVKFDFTQATDNDVSNLASPYFGPLVVLCTRSCLVLVVANSNMYHLNELSTGNKVFNSHLENNVDFGV